MVQNTEFDLKWIQFVSLKTSSMMRIAFKFICLIKNFIVFIYIWYYQWWHTKIREKNLVIAKRCVFETHLYANAAWIAV